MLTPAARSACLLTIGIAIWLTGCLDSGMEIGETPSEDGAAAAAQAVQYDGADTDEGQRLFVENCAACHGAGATERLDLQGVTGQMEWTEFTTVLDEGPDVMPAWPQLEENERRDLWAFLAIDEELPVAEGGEGGGCGCAQRVAASDKDVEQARQEARANCGAGCCDSGGCGAVQGQGSSCGSN